MGRPRKPLSQHKKDGTFRADRHSNHAPDLPPCGPRECPADMPEYGRKMWETLLPNVGSVYTEADYQLLEKFCLWHAIEKMALKSMDVDIAANASKRAIALATKLCISPQDRAKMPVRNVVEEDELEKLAKFKVTG